MAWRKPTRFDQRKLLRRSSRRRLLAGFARLSAGPLSGGPKTEQATISHFQNAADIGRLCVCPKKQIGIGCVMVNSSFRWRNFIATSASRKSALTWDASWVETVLRPPGCVLSNLVNNSISKAPATPWGPEPKSNPPWFVNCRLCHEIPPITVRSAKPTCPLTCFMPHQKLSSWGDHGNRSSCILETKFNLLPVSRGSTELVLGLQAVF